MQAYVQRFLRLRAQAPTVLNEIVIEEWLTVEYHKEKGILNVEDQDCLRTIDDICAIYEQIAELKDKYNGIHHYLYNDAKFLEERVRRTLKKYIEDSSFWEDATLSIFMLRVPPRW